MRPAALPPIALLVAVALCPLRASAAEPAPRVEPATVIEQAQPGHSEAAARVLAWIARTHDNGELPYAVIDKQAARTWLFDAAGKPRGTAPVLIGIAAGDDSSPGVGTKKLDELGPAEKTTPAGRFLARYGYAAGNKRVLWIDYADSVALHPVVTTNPNERRQQRLDSPAADDNRITFGCVNVPGAFYGQTVRPLFRKAGGVIYVLPDTKPLEAVFPALWVEG